MFLLIKGWLNKQSPAMTHCGTHREGGLLDGKHVQDQTGKYCVAWYKMFHRIRWARWPGSSHLSGKGAEHTRQPDFQQTLKHNIGINLCQVPKCIPVACLFLASSEWLVPWPNLAYLGPSQFHSPAACCWSSSARAVAAASLGGCWGMCAGLQSLFLGRAACAGCSALPRFSGIWGLLALHMPWGAVSLRAVTLQQQHSSSRVAQPAAPSTWSRWREREDKTHLQKYVWPKVGSDAESLVHGGWAQGVRGVSVQQFPGGAGLREQELFVLLPRAAGLVPATALGWAPAPIRAVGASAPSPPAQGGSRPFISVRVRHKPCEAFLLSPSLFVCLEWFQLQRERRWRPRSLIQDCHLEVMR